MTISTTVQFNNEPQKALLVGVCLPGTRRFEESMQELEGLCEACGLVVCGTAVQNLKRPDSATCIGPGKVEEIRAAADTLHADLVIFNNTLSPSQLANLSKALEPEVIDRTNLILNIFALRARTAEAKMQVDYAKLKYMLPRLVGLRSNLSRQGGTGGTSLSNRGAGEQKIELDRRVIERRMTLLRRRLAELDQTRETQRAQRARSGLPLVAMAGYTNAGKSTLMNYLLDYCTKQWDGSPAESKPLSGSRSPAENGIQSADAPRIGASGQPAGAATDDPENSKHVYVENMLFATLDTSVRRIEPDGRRPFLLSDTVGFIDDLPTALIEAFRSTLSEVRCADLILHVIDAADPESANQASVTEQTLGELGAGDIPVIRVMNKSDLTFPAADHGSAADTAAQADGADAAEAANAADAAAASGSAVGSAFPAPRRDRVWISAKSGEGIDCLLDTIDLILNAGSMTCTFLIPYVESGLENALRRDGIVHTVEYGENGSTVSATLDRPYLAKYEKYVI